MEDQAEYQATKQELKIAKYDVNEAAISKMASIYLDLTIDGIEDKKGFEAVHSARMVMVRHRTGIEKLRLDANKSHQAIIKHNNVNALKLVNLMAPIEDHLSTEEKRIINESEAIRAEDERVERERIEAHRKRIAEIQAYGIVLPTLSSTAIQLIVESVENIDTSESKLEEFWTEATLVKTSTLNALYQAHNARVVWESEEVERKAEAGRLEKVAAEQEAERKRLAEIGQSLEREIEEKREHFEKIHQDIEAEVVAQREAFEKEQAKFGAAIEAGKTAKARGLAAEKDAILKAEKEEADRLAQEEADKSEDARQELLKPDKEKLMAFTVRLKIVLYEAPMLAKLGDEEARIILQNALTAINDAVNIIEEYAT